MTNEPANYIYRLEEMSDEMVQSIAQAKKVCEEQDTLISIVEAHEDAAKFVEFTNSLRDSIAHTRNQVVTLELRQALLDTAIKACNNDSNMAHIVSNLLVSLGVVELTDVQK